MAYAYTPSIGTRRLPNLTRLHSMPVVPIPLDCTLLIYGQEADVLTDHREAPGGRACYDLVSYGRSFAPLSYFSL